MPAQPSTIASRAIVALGGLDLRLDARAGIAVRVLEREHGNLGRAHPRAARGEAVLHQVLLDGGNRTGPAW